MGEYIRGSSNDFMDLHVAKQETYVRLSKKFFLKNFIEKGLCFVEIVIETLKK